LGDYFAAMDYRLPRVREGGARVPRAYLATLPSGMDKLAPAERRKALFIRIVLPLALKANEELLATRRRIEALRETFARHGSLSDGDRAWLLAVGERYLDDPGEALHELDFAGLLARVDMVPPSLTITQSMRESGWGRSRFAREGNALFGQRTWEDETPDLQPAKADGFKVRAFETLGASLRAYLHNLNTAEAYAGLREARVRMRATGGRIDGYRLAGALRRYSEEGAAYVRKLRDLMADNGLRAFDRAALRPAVIAQRVLPDAGVDKLHVALDLDGAEVALVASAVYPGVGVERFFPETGLGEANAVLVTGDGRHVEDDQHLAAAVFRLANKGEDAAFMV
jgi:Bax protein